MIHNVEGDLFDNKEVEVFVNPVNCEGVMGKGIAKEFKRRYPAMFDEYHAFCAAGLLRRGEVMIWENPDFGRTPRYIFNVATKDKWRNVSKGVWISKGLFSIMSKMYELGLHTVAMPALGCGEGRLRWVDAQRTIVDATGWYRQRWDITIWLYKPLDSR